MCWTEFENMALYEKYTEMDLREWLVECQLFLVNASSQNDSIS